MKLKIVENKKIKLSEIGDLIDVKAVSLDESTVDLFVSQMNAGVYFPPIIVFRSENKWYVLDGRTRREAYRRLSREVVECSVVEYTTKADMITAAFAANITSKGTPVPPTLADYRKVIRSLVKEGLTAPAATQRLVEAGVPGVFAGRLVKEEVKNGKQRDLLHAAEYCEKRRGTVDEATLKYHVDKGELEAYIKGRGYNLDTFGMHVSQRLAGTHKLFARLANEQPDKVPDAIKILRRELKVLDSWVTLQDVNNR